MTTRIDAFKKRLDGHGAQWMEWRGEQVVQHFGDPDEEYRAVRSGGVGLADHSWRDTLVVMGSDSVPWLQGLVTSDLLELAEEGSGQLTTAVNNTGRLIAEARVLHMPEMLLLDLEPGILGDFLPHLRRHIITEDVQLVDRSEATARLSLYGHDAADLLDRLGETVRPVSALGPFEATWGALGDEDIVVQRVPTAGEPGFDVSCATEAALRVWNSLAEHATPIGFEPLETLRIEAGVPRFGKELTEKRIPLEAGLEHAISFDKGCYLGQEIIARLDTLGTPARLLRTLVFDGGAAPNEGASVERDQRSVGEVVSSVWSPLLEAPIALAYVKRDHNDIGNEVEVEGRTARVAALGVALGSRDQNLR